MCLNQTDGAELVTEAKTMSVTQAIDLYRFLPDARLFLFGSSKNGFGFRNSDIDICMTLENHFKEEVQQDAIFSFRSC